jgi:hypothetical protein
MQTTSNIKIISALWRVLVLGNLELDTLYTFWPPIVSVGRMSMKPYLVALRMPWTYLISQVSDNLIGMVIIMYVTWFHLPSISCTYSTTWACEWANPRWFLSLHTLCQRKENSTVEAVSLSSLPCYSLSLSVSLSLSLTNSLTHPLPLKSCVHVGTQCLL